MEERIKHIDYYVIQSNPAYVHVFKLARSEDFTNQDSKASRTYNWLHKCQSTFTISDYLKSLNPSVSHTYNHSNLILK